MRGRENYPESYRGSVLVFVSVSNRKFSFPSTIISTNTAGFNLCHRQFNQSVVRSRLLNANLSLSSDDLFFSKKIKLGASLAGAALVAAHPLPHPIPRLLQESKPHLSLTLSFYFIEDHSFKSFGCAVLDPLALSLSPYSFLLLWNNSSVPSVPSSCSISHVSSALEPAHIVGLRGGQGNQRGTRRGSSWRERERGRRDSGLMEEREREEEEEEGRVRLTQTSLSDSGHL